MLATIEGDNRYDPILEQVLIFCLDNMDDHWEWCKDNVFEAFSANDFVVRKDKFRADAVKDFEKKIQIEMNELYE